MNFVTGGMLNKSALLTAAGKGNLRQVRTLLEGNPGLIAHKSLHGNNALHNAAANGHCDMVIWLVEHGGARPELVDGEGRTALMRARNNNHTAVVEYLRNYCSAGDGDSRNGNDIRVETTGAAPPSLLSSIGSGLKTLGSSTKKAMGIGIGRLSISLPAGVMYMPGRDSIEGVIQLVDVPEPIQGQSLTVRLEAYRKVVRYNNEGRAVHSNQQEYSDGYELAAAQQYVNNEQFRFRLRVPVIERRLAQGQDSGTLMGSFLGAVDSVRAVSRNPLQWKVTASLSIPLCWGMGGAVHVAVAEPGQEVAHTPARTRMHRPAPAQHVPAAAAAAAAATTTTPPSEGMVPANGHLCNICYMEEHDPDVLAVACDNGHYLCETCFASWVESQSDIDGNPQKVILNQGKIHCVCRESSNCNSEAFRNKLIACAVPDEIYEGYLQARDFVVGKEAVAGALAKIVTGDGTDAVEQEQIRNMYRRGDGSFSTYMCRRCRFGPIDHGWCNDLAAHHGEEKQSGRSVVNNACPKCGWFADTIGEWPRWDGSFQTQGVSTES